MKLEWSDNVEGMVMERWKSRSYDVWYTKIDDNTTINTTCRIACPFVPELKGANGSYFVQFEAGAIPLSADFDRFMLLVGELKEIAEFFEKKEKD